MKNLSKNLPYKEFIRSRTASKHGIDNTPTKEHLENGRAIAKHIFQPTRDFYGKPITVTSGYRSKALNDKIGGSQTSQHSKGEALDLDTLHDNTLIFFYILNHLDFDQLIYELGDDENPDWVHVSYKRNGKNRGQALRAVRSGGKVIYKPFYRGV